MSEVSGAGLLPFPAHIDALRPTDPRELGDFRILGRLGSGGMGIAFLAERDGAWCVVKMFRSELSEDRGFAARMARELEAMKMATGPYTADVIDQHLDGYPAWFAMDFIPGSTLARRVEEGGPLSGSDLADFASQLRVAIESMHEAGLVHRDLKPSNIILSPAGPRLIDFGIADVSDGTQLTSTGHVLGTIGWLAPEQVSGDPVTPATDLHAWALCVLFAATGEVPFGSGTVPVTMRRVLDEIPEIPDSVTQPLRNQVSRCLAKDPTRRELDDLLPTEPPTEPTIPLARVPVPPRRGPGRGWVLVLVLVMVTWWWNSLRCLAGSRRSRVAAVLVGCLVLVGGGAVAWSQLGNGAAPASTQDDGGVAQAPSESTPPSAEPGASAPPTTAPVSVDTVEPPAAPKGLKVVAEDSSAKLVWKPVAGATEYVVYQRRGTQGFKEVLRVPASQLNGKGNVQARVADLVNGREYQFSVAALVDELPGARSKGVAVTPVAAPVAPPESSGSAPPASQDPAPQPDPGPTLVLEDPNELVLQSN
ncbi:MAG: protein kinase [Candidatus Nanopelagicales bacterium]